MTERVRQKLTHALRYWLLRQLPTCQQMTHVMSASLERPLTLRERISLRLHLWVCIWCVWYLEHLQLMRDAMRARAEHMPDSAPADLTLTTEARERLKRALASKRT